MASQLPYRSGRALYELEHSSSFTKHKPSLYEVDYKSAIAGGRLKSRTKGLLEIALVIVYTEAHYESAARRKMNCARSRNSVGNRLTTFASEEKALSESLSAWSLPVGSGMQLTNIAIEAAYLDQCDFALWLLAERLHGHEIEARLSLYEAGAHEVADYLKLFNRPSTIDRDLYDRFFFWWALSAWQTTGGPLIES